MSQEEFEMKNRNIPEPIKRLGRATIACGSPLVDARLSSELITQGNKQEFIAVCDRESYLFTENENYIYIFEGSIGEPWIITPTGRTEVIIFDDSIREELETLLPSITWIFADQVGEEEMKLKTPFHKHYQDRLDEIINQALGCEVADEPFY